MRILLSAVGICACIAAMGTTVTAHADNSRLKFSTPSGDIRCVLATDQGTTRALCQLGQITYQVPPGVAHDVDGGPCPGDSGSGRDLRLDQGRPGYVQCSYAALDAGVGPWPTLEYGKALSLDSITCESAPASVTCTDNGTGHFFRVSRDFYDLG